ncbi:MAG: UDP-N-acetylmuramoyl-L-alanyl-D-glutamate--2,6-diaminopimelate ligase, partial [Acidimicrobiia bacterium]|nr:UDP-N-acetylmuramoyl-L-alanyl-D-glutamate--2,6-diaminopimelate ligase [Acidimicrobiia bacterium]
MRLAALIESAELISRQVVGDATVEVNGVAHDSRAVTAGTLFCCVRGSRVDGHAHAAAAVTAGAVGLVVDHLLPIEAPVAQVVVDDVRVAMGVLAAAAAGHPSRALGLVGGTGTNGKTTTVTLLRAILEAAGHRAEVIGTLTSAPVASAPPTTPDA